MDTATAIIVAVFGSGLIQFLITRHDNSKNIKGKLLTLEKDVLRTQLLLLILMKPQERQEIMTIAEHYFKDLKGDWYMTSIFKKWLNENNIEEPIWFDSKN